MLSAVQPRSMTGLEKVSNSLARTKLDTLRDRFSDPAITILGVVESVARYKNLAVLVGLSLLLSACSTASSLMELVPGLGQEESEQAPIGQGLSSDEWLDNANSWRVWNSGLASNESAQWSFEENAISVSLVSSDSLNLYGGAAHTLQYRIVQLTDPSAFRTLGQTPEGIKTLLTEDLEMIPNAVTIEGGLIAPGAITSLSIPRQKDSMFVGLIFGYADLETTASLRLIPIPVLTLITPVPEPSLLSKISLGYLDSDEEVAEPVADVIRPGKLLLNLNLGDSAIRELAITAN